MALKNHFEKGGKYAWAFPLYEMIATVLITPARIARRAPYIHGAVDTKRIMIYVVLAVLVVYIFAYWNIGHEAAKHLAQMGTGQLVGWQGALLRYLHVPIVENAFWSNFFIGMAYLLPIYVVALFAGGVAEILFAVIRKHEITEGFTVTSALFPLTLPVTIPLWQVAVGILFGVVIAKEIFGGQGKNFLNPALAGRAFIYFAYPTSLSGSKIWHAIDTYTAPTPLANPHMWMPNSAVPLGQVVQGGGEHISWWQAFIGTIPGSMGETSALLILALGLILIYMRIVNWRPVVAAVLGTIVMASILNAFGSQSNLAMNMPWYWHIVLGGYMLGLIFMIPEPVTSPATNIGRWVYGFIVGCLIVVVRVLNPGYAEGVMLAILFGNVISPLIDYIVSVVDIRRRTKFYGKKAISE